MPSNRFSPALAELSSVTNHNKYHFHYVDVLSAASLSLKSYYEFVDVMGITVVAGRFKPDNLMHLLHDDVFPLMDTMKQLAIEGQELRVFFFDDWGHSFNYPMMKFGGDVVQLIPAQSFLTPNQFPGRQFVCFREAHIGLSKETTWYDYGFHQPQGPLPHQGQEVTLRNTVDAIIHKLGLEDRVCDSRTLILVSRKKTRLIVNEMQVMQTLASVTGMPVVALQLEEATNFTELVWRVRCAKVLVGVHGSALVLSAFLPADAALVEIFPYAINPRHYTPYKILCQLLGLKYRTWKNEKRENSKTHADFHASLGGIHHLPDSKIREITESTEVKPHLCCNDPEWLFRAYQDTIVDVDSFSVPVLEVWSQVKHLHDNQSHGADLAPGPVMSPNCITVGKTAEISWSEPWNLRLIGLKAGDDAVIKYEVVVQTEGKSERQAIQTQSLRLKLELRGRQNLVWIRCLVAGVTGPFSPEPLYC